MEPHPDREGQPEVRAGGRGRVIVWILVGGIVLVVVALHLAGAMSLHSQ